ncbi:MAG: 3-hydroxyacyl-CoA dehydrogenase family protein [Propionibacteriales bacterium]|nr:3-hydroxyacyl-CoA dehydrogenase family protein [Propionibacteriales bacterium]
MTARELAVAVLGAGTMGAGIAVVAARAGHRTILRDVSEDALERGLENASGFLEKSASLGKLTAEEARAARANLTGRTDLADLAPADVVIEAVFEDLALKQRLLGELDDVISDDALVHTNTSTLSVTAIAAGSRRPDRVVGTHYCNPAQLMTLVEVAEGRHTSPQATTRSREFLDGVGKTTVLTKDRPGFIVNRFLIPWENNCIRALEEGHGTVESIDRAVVGALRHPMGPFQLLDVVGLDVHQAVSMRLYEQLHDPRFAPPPLVDRMAAAGDLGRKTGRGFYTYDNRRSFGA